MWRLSVRYHRLQALPPALLQETPVDKMYIDGNLLTKKQFTECDGFDEFQFQERRGLLMRGTCAPWIFGFAAR